MPLDDAFDPNRLAGNIQRTPPLPVAGFWIRLFAFLLDWVLLTFFFYSLTLVAREPLLALGVWAGPLAATLIFAYFWLCDGPLGKGRTLGKAVLGLQTISARDGSPLSWGRSALRALVLVPPQNWVFYYLLPLMTLAQPSPSARLVAGFAAQGLFFSLYLAQLIRTALSPTRQGLHDGIADSLVVRHSQTATTWGVLEELLGPGGLMRTRRARQSGWITLIACMGLFGYLSQQTLRDPAMREVMATLGETEKVMREYRYTLGPMPLREPLPETYRASLADSGGGLSSADAPTTSPGVAMDAASSTETAGPTSAEGRQPLLLTIPVYRTGRDARPPEAIRAEFGRFVDYHVEMSRRQQDREEIRLREREATEGKKPGTDRLDPFLIPAGSVLIYSYQEFLDLVLFKKGYPVLQEERRWE